MILAVSDLVKHYETAAGAVKAVDGASFFVENGEFVAISGRSGSGKTTLLHLVGGLENAQSGSIVINGKELSATDQEERTVFRRRQIGFVFQSYNLLPILNVRDNILLPIGLDGQPPDLAFFDEVTDALGIRGKLHETPNHLSGGEQQRVAIARAIITKPSLVLADEPTGNLDTRTSEDVLSLLKHTAKRFGQTTLIITHDERIAEQADRVLRMESGKISDVQRTKGEALICLD